jgi:hypothetical protein
MSRKAGHHGHVLSCSPMCVICAPRWREGNHGKVEQFAHSGENGETVRDAALCPHVVHLGDGRLTTFLSGRKRGLQVI